MINLDYYLRFTEKTVSNWGYREVRQVLTTLVRNIGDTEVDWEPRDEEWARLLVNREVVALICAKIPLIIMLKIYKERAKSLIAQESKILLIADFDEPIFCVSVELLEEIFGRKMTSDISYEALSIQDLWWATVT
ncbi:MAG: hypothetical protein AAGA60_17205 [Cyanobacteria bacterium P01_E01_bin.42]